MADAPEAGPDAALCGERVAGGQSLESCSSFGVLFT
jgi:hypothetical protein